MLKTLVAAFQYFSKVLANFPLLYYCLNCSTGFSYKYKDSYLFKTFPLFANDRATGKHSRITTAFRPWTPRKQVELLSGVWVATWLNLTLLRATVRGGELPVPLHAQPLESTLRIDLVPEYNVLESPIRKYFKILGVFPFLPEDHIDFAWKYNHALIQVDITPFVPEYNALKSPIRKYFKILGAFPFLPEDHIDFAWKHIHALIQVDITPFVPEYNVLNLRSESTSRSWVPSPSSLGIRSTLPENTSTLLFK